MHNCSLIPTENIEKGEYHTTKHIVSGESVTCEHPSNRYSQQISFIEFNLKLKLSLKPVEIGDTQSKAG